MKLLKISLSLTLIFVLLFSFNGCLKYTSNILEVTNPGIQQTTQAPVVETTLPQQESTTLPTVETTTLPAVEQTPQKCRRVL